MDIRSILNITEENTKFIEKNQRYVNGVPAPWYEYNTTFSVNEFTISFWIFKKKITCIDLLQIFNDYPTFDIRLEKDRNTIVLFLNNHQEAYYFDIVYKRDYDITRLYEQLSWYVKTNLSNIDNMILQELPIDKKYNLKCLSLWDKYDLISIFKKMME